MRILVLRSFFGRAFLCVFLLCVAACGDSEQARDESPSNDAYVEDMAREHADFTGVRELVLLFCDTESPRWLALRA